MVSTAALNPALDQPVEEKPLAALVSRISQGDERALGTLYDNTGGMVYGLTLRVVGDPACAEDITLEVLSPGLAHCTKLQPARGSVSAWLVTLVRSRAIDWLRSRKARSAEVTEPIDDVHELQDKRASPEVASMDASRAQAVREAMASLPEEQRKLIELAYFSGLSHNEIARNMALPLGTMKSRIRLGALHMRESLGPYTEELRRTRRRSTREACTTSHPCMRSMCWVRKIESDSSGIWSPVALNARQKSVPSAMSRFIWRTRWRLSLPANYGTGSCRRRKVPLARRAFLFESNGLLIARSSEMHGRRWHRKFESSGFISIKLEDTTRLLSTWTLARITRATVTRRLRSCLCFPEIYTWKAKSCRPAIIAEPTQAPCTVRLSPIRAAPFCCGPRQTTKYSPDPTETVLFESTRLSFSATNPLHCRSYG